MRSNAPTNAEKRSFVRSLRLRHPPLKEAVLADFAAARRQRGDQRHLRSRTKVGFEILRLCLVSDAFGALVLYRVKTASQRRGIPLVPRLAHRLAMSWAQLVIGDPVVIQPGVIIPHGQIVIDGLTEIGRGVRVRPFAAIGLREGNLTGPKIHDGASIGTGAKVLGPLTIGRNAIVGANAVVVSDVPAYAVVAGVPAKVIRQRSGGQREGKNPK